MKKCREIVFQVLVSCVYRALDNNTINGISGIVDTSMFRVDVLKSENYLLWSRDIKLVLRLKEVREIGSGEEELV